MSKGKSNKAMFLAGVVGFGLIWLSLRARKRKLQVITTKNRVFMLDDMADYYELELPRDETIKTMKWVAV